MGINPLIALCSIRHRFSRVRVAVAVAALPSIAIRFAVGNRRASGASSGRGQRP